MSAKKIRSAYSGQLVVNVPLSGEPTPTKQEFKKEVNINTIIQRMQKGISPPQWMTSATPRFGDFTDMPCSFQEAYAVIERAEESFKSLPLEFRRALDHNPANLQNAPRELYEKFGLLKKSDAAEVPSAPTSKDSTNPKGASGTKKGAEKSPENADE